MYLLQKVVKYHVTFDINKKLNLTEALQAIRELWPVLPIASYTQENFDQLISKYGNDFVGKIILESKMDLINDIDKLSNSINTNDNYLAWGVADSFLLVVSAFLIKKCFF